MYIRWWLVPLAVFVGLGVTLVTMEITIASSQMYGYCENNVYGFPLPVQYARPQYNYTSVLPDQPGGTVFADCVWPEAQGGGKLIVRNLLSNWLLYVALAYSIFRLIPKRSKRSDMKLFLFGLGILVVVMGVWIWHTNYRNQIADPPGLGENEQQSGKNFNSAAVE